MSLDGCTQAKLDSPKKPTGMLFGSCLFLRWDACGSMTRAGHGLCDPSFAQTNEFTEKGFGVLSVMRGRFRDFGDVVVTGSGVGGGTDFFDGSKVQFNRDDKFFSIGHPSTLFPIPHTPRRWNPNLV